MKKWLVSGFLSGLAIFVLSNFASFFSQAIFSYNVLALGGMRSINDSVMFLFFVYPWVLGFALSWLYLKVKNSFKGDYLVKGRDFGFCTWLVAGLPSAFLVFSSMNYPLGFTINSVLGSLVYFIVAGVVITKFSD
ncbi:MAG: hypothetical protein ABH803_00365 [Candidatus Micrarchaeota archaeon]